MGGSMKRPGLYASFIVCVCLLFGMLPLAWGASDGFYTVAEATFAWDGTDANLLHAPTSDYNYTYGDEKSVSYTLPWSLPFYDQNYSRIVADTNGNIWFAASDAASAFNLTNTGRGPAIALWNNDLSSSYNGGVFIQHKTGPERVVIEWQTETYTEEGLNVPNTFAAILYPNGTIRLNYKTFSTQFGSDAGSGITRGDGTAYLDVTALYGSAPTLAGRSFQFSPQSQVVSVSKSGSGTISSAPSGITCGTNCSAYFTQGKTIELTATPAFGSVFDSWTGACTGSGTCSLTIDSAKDVSATFLETYAPAVVINSPTGITTSRPTLNYAVSTGTAVVKVDGVSVTKMSGDLLDSLTAGTHTVRVEATNSAGHLGFAESSFTVDGTPPTATIIPSTNSTNVPVRMSVLIQFSEQIDPASITDATASLVSKGLTVPGDLRIAGDGKSLIFKPQSKLNYAAGYTFTLKAGVRDLFGNAISSDTVSTFSTPLAGQDLAGYWPMNGDWTDYSAYGNNGTSSGSATFAAGRIDGISSASFVIDSKSFDGSGGAVTTQPKIVTDISDSFTMSFWAKPTATRESTTETNTTQVLGAGVQRFAIAPVNAFNLGHQGASAGVSVGTNGISVFEETTIDGLFSYMPSLLVYDATTPLTGWNHIAVVYNNKQPSLYLNGVLVKTGQTSLQKNVYPSAVFAYGNERPTGAYSGQMEEVAYYKRALTAPEIQSLYQGQTQPLPQISLTSPGQTTKYKPSESGSATVSVTSTSGITKLFCSASGGASDGELAINFDSPVLSTTQQLNFQVSAHVAVPIVLSCVARTTDGLFGVAELQLQPVDLVSPTVVSSVPVNNAVDVSAAMPISITFSKAMDSTSFILNDTLRIQRADTGKLVTGTFALSSDATILSFTPSPALEALTHYTVTVSRVRDIVGNAIENDFVLNFLTLQQPTLTIENMGSSTTPYVLAPGRYGTLSLTNSYVSITGDATVDTATIANSTLNISSGTTGSSGSLNVTYGDLTLTDSSVGIAGSVNVSGNINQTNSTLTTAKTTQVTGDILLRNQSVLTHFAATLTDTSKLDISAATINVDATSKIDVSSKGYLGAYQGSNTTNYGRTSGNITSTGSYYTSGGSYGGLGGYSSGYQVNAVYGDPADPNYIGSGGGGNGASYPGGSGGGLLRLKAKNLVLNGVILADGGSTTYSGGSGGGIRLDIGTLSGSGAISANGGVSASAGGGSGGRIAIYYWDKAAYSGSVTVAGGTGGKPGNIGTLCWKSAYQDYADLQIDNSGITNAQTTLPTGRYGNVVVKNTTIVLSGSVTADSLSLQSGTILTTKAASLSSAERLIVSAETLTIDATSRIDVSALGYLSGNSGGNGSTSGRTYGNTATGGSDRVNGGSYGGLGGINNSSNAVGSVYGDPLDPSDPGSGGGSRDTFGGNGGGVIRLKAGALTVDGSILADGGNATTGAGGGSGGSIRIDATVVGGSGIIRAKGGTNTSSGGGGGGGRIALYYGTLNLPQANISATGGTGATNGGPGSIYFKNSAMTRGQLLIDNRGIDTANQLTPLPGIDRGKVSALTATSLTSSTGGWLSGALKGQKFNPNLAQDKTFTIIDNTATTLYIDPTEGDLTQVSAVGNSYAGIFAPESLTITGKARILSASKLQATGDLIVDGGSLYTAYNDITADTVTVKNSGLIAHLAATKSATYKLELNALTLLTIDATSRIDVTALGYLGGETSGRTYGNTTTGGSVYFNGGSYGGLGGRYNSGYAVNSVYGDPLDPSDPGSAGGSYDTFGGNGGGVIRLKAGTLTVDGSILADGGNATTGAGGGSGGSIRIDATVVGGSGIIRAKGGTNTSSGGGGGGGRIALYYGTLNLPQANISVGGGTGAVYGATGSLFMTTDKLLATAKTGTGSGTIVSTPSGISCGSACSYVFATSSNVNLTATPDSGSAFNGWTGACSGSGSCTVTLDVSKNVTATFTTIPVPTVSISSPATITNNNQPTLLYTISAGTVVVKVDGVVVNKVSGDTLDTLSDGTHVIRVEATVSGVTGYAEDTITVKTTPPAVTVNAIQVPVNTTSYTLSGTIDSGSTVSISANTAASIGTVTYPTTSTWQCVVSNLATGLNTFTITGKDQAGNTSTISASVAYVPPLAIVLSSPTIASDFQGTMPITISNVYPAGSDVLIEQFIDANQNGVIDTGDALIRSFKLTDGISSANLNVQGDEDATANGAVTTTLSYYLTSDLYHAPGSYLFRATSGTNTSSTTCTVTQATQAQSVSGTVTDGANPVPGAMVQLVDKWMRPVGWTIADSTGKYTMGIKTPGDYVVLPFAYGYITATNISPTTIASGQNVTSHDLQLVAGTVHLSGTVRKDQASDPVGGVWITASGTNKIGLALSSADGAYGMALSADQYDVFASSVASVPNPSSKGYLALAKPTQQVNLAADTTGIDLALPAGGILVTGKVTDQNGASLPGLPVQAMLPFAADPRGPVAGGVTTSSGGYALEVISGNSWNILLDDQACQKIGYIGTSIKNFGTANPLTGNNLIAHQITAWVQGTVKDSSGNLLANADVQLRNTDSSIVVHTKSASDGTYKLGAFAGLWYVNAFIQNNGQYPVGEQSITLSDGQTATADFLVNLALPAVTINPVATPTKQTTQTITGTMAANSQITVSADTTVTVGTVSYPTSTTWSCQLSNVVEGRNTITVTVQDSTGATNTVTTAIVLDTTAPIVTISSPVAGTTHNNTPQLIFAVSKGSAVVSVDGSAVTAVSGNLLGPLASGSHSLQVVATDPAGNTGSAQVAITVVDSSLAITTASLPSGSVGATYTQTLSCTGGTSGYTWSLIGGSLPAGLSLSTATGQISGTPTTSGSSTFSVMVTDSAGNQTAQTFTLSII